MSGAEVTYYDKELKYLHHLFKALPKSIPVGDIHNLLVYLCADCQVGRRWSTSAVSRLL
jgi:hypothetical protein